MKKLLLLTILGLLFFAGKSQNTWCPAGAQWHYGWGSMGEMGFVHYRYNKDTVLQNRTCHQIISTVYSSMPDVGGYIYLDTIDGANIYTYSSLSNDTLFFYYETSGKWLPTYFFNAQVGDTLIIPNHEYQHDTTVTAIVDSVGVMQIDTSSLRYYVFHLSLGWGYYFTGKAVEKLGMINNDMIPFWHAITDDYMYGFRCYEDSSFALYRADSINCTYLQTNANSCHAYFSLYPDTLAPGVYYGYNQATQYYTTTYLWDFGDGNTSTQQYPSHTYAQAGQYYVCLTVNSFTCSDTYCDSSYVVFKTEDGLMYQLNILNPLGISEIPTPQFSISPNPATTSITISIDETLLGSTATIYDITGKKMAAVLLSIQHSTLSTASFANGIYFITLDTSKGRTTKKLVIQK